MVRKLDSEALKSLQLRIVKEASQMVEFRPDQDWFEAFWSRKNGE